MSDLSDLIEFKTLITPTVMSIVWVLGAGGIALAALTMLAGGSYKAATFWLVFGQLGWRLFTEAVVVLFAIHESLRAIERKP